jgi:two-component system, LytTR family, sensor kinase
MRMTRISRWGLIALVWALVSTIQTTFLFEMWRDYGKPRPWIEIARQPFVAYFLMWGLIATPLVLFLCKRFPVERRNWPRRFLLHLAFSIVLGILISLARLPLHQFVYPASHESFGWMMFRGYFFTNGFDDITMYWAVACICFSSLYYQRAKDREIQASALESQLARAHLEALKMQLHPHFLFNTLHSISELMHQDVSAADRVIARLSELLRLTLENTGVQEVTLKAEIDFLQGYLEIERTRFRDRLTVAMDLKPETLDAMVPNMILQPLVENSVRHGIARRAGPGTILVRSSKNGGNLEILLRDDGPGRSPAPPPSANFGVGLNNTRTRLQQMYGDAQRLDIRQPETGGFEVQITIPYHVAPEPLPVSEPVVTFLNTVRPIPHRVPS